MCYAIPGKLVEINGKIGIIDYFGEKRKVLIDEEVSVGDYVYAQGGVIVSKVPENEAIEVLDFWKERFFELKKIDEEVSAVKAEGPLLELLQKVNLGKELSKENLLKLLNLENEEEKLLYQFANNLRQRKHDNACCVHGIIEFSNYCRCNCLYCGIRKDSSIERYRMIEEEIINAAKDAVENGFKALVLQSGEDLWYDDEKLVNIVKEIRKLGVLIFLSIGERSEELYRKLYDAGARAILLRFETSNKEIFEKLRPGTTLDKRIQLIKDLKSMGYIIATGFIIGLGESDEDLLNNILLTKELQPDMYSFGPLIPSKDTPLNNMDKVDKDLVLKTIAVSRLVDPMSKILVTTALETLDPEAKKQGLMAGANSLMLTATPPGLKELYNIYDNKDKGGDIKENINKTVELLYSIGRAPTDLGV